MNRLVIFLLLSLILSQNDITTKEFSFYYNNDLDFFDFKESIEDFNGIYRIELISLDDIKFERTKKVFIEQCDLSFNLKNNLSSIDIKRCDNQLSFKKFAYIDNENHTLDINHSKYHMLSCTFKFWITGNFAANQNLNINNDGVLNEFYDNGKLRLSYNFSDGKKDGMQKKWYNNGQLEVLYNYTNGKLDGEQKKWHNNGNTKGTWYYKNDVLHGILTEWYSNGNLKHKKKYDNGTLIELLENYDINGSKLD